MPDTIDSKFKLLAENSQLGPSRADIVPELKYFSVERYLIIYRIVTNVIEIVRVVHGMRNPFNLS